MRVGQQPRRVIAYLNLNLGLGDILLATISGGNLLGFLQLAPNGLGAEVFDRCTFNSVDAELRSRLDGSKSTRHCEW